MKCKLVDVFAQQKLSGNGLTIFYDYDTLNNQQMLALTQEMRQFESIFVSQPASQTASEKTNSNSVRARIFTVEEELDFAGHPIIGLAAHLHDECGSRENQIWQIELNQKTVQVKTEATEQYFKASMDQGKPEFLRTISSDQAEQILLALNLTLENLAPYPMEVVSTGLPYLIVPIANGLERAKILTPELENMLEKLGAKFVYVFDVNEFEGRTWDNDGSVEDIATGSAAGPTAAYLYKHQLCTAHSPITIAQGRFVGRPSQIEIFIEVKEEQINNIWVSGSVVKVADMVFA